MSISKEELRKVLPKNGPNIDEVSKYIEKYKDEIITIKYGGNVFIDRQIFNNFISDLSILQKLGLSVVVVHGGGPRIKRELDKSHIVSKFVRGLRVTDEKIIDIVEKVLIEFNEDISMYEDLFSNGQRVFHGVLLDDEGNLIEDNQEPEYNCLEDFLLKQRN